MGEYDTDSLPFNLAEVKSMRVEQLSERAQIEHPSHSVRE